MFALLFIALTAIHCHALHIPGASNTKLHMRGVTSGAANPFNGQWQLDNSHEVGSSDAVLQLIGVGETQRAIINTLTVVERYTLSDKTMRLVRDAGRFSHTDETFHLGVEEGVTDVILGHMQQTVTYQPNRINTLAVRPDHSTYSSLRRIQPTKPNQFTNTINFTTSDGRHASCTRYYNRVGLASGVRTAIVLPNDVRIDNVVSNGAS